MGGRTWRRCFWTLRVDAGKRRRPRNERYQRTLCGACDFLVSPRRRDGAALLVSAALVLAASAGVDLLAGGADADVGLSADVCIGERRLLRAGRGDFHRRGAAVGHS